MTLGALKPDFDRFLSKLSQAPSFGGVWLIPIAVPYRKAATKEIVEYVNYADFELCSGQKNESM